METEEKNEKQVYEVGYHIIPLVEESEVTSKAAKIRSVIEENGGSLIAEEMPKSLILAYDISKFVGGKKHDFNKAHFGWIKFEVEPAKIGAIKTKIESLEEVLRFLIIKTVRENIMHVPKIPMFKKESAPREEKTEGGADKPKASEAEIDKSIDDLVIN